MPFFLGWRAGGGSSKDRPSRSADKRRSFQASHRCRSNSRPSFRPFSRLSFRLSSSPSLRPSSRPSLRPSSFSCLILAGISSTIRPCRESDLVSMNSQGGLLAVLAGRVGRWRFVERPSLTLGNQTAFIPGQPLLPFRFLAFFPAFFSPLFSPFLPTLFL